MVDSLFFSIAVESSDYKMAAAARATAKKEDPVQTAPAPFSGRTEELFWLAGAAELLLELTMAAEEVVTG